MPFHLPGLGIHIADPRPHLTVGTCPRTLLLSTKINWPQTRVVLPPQKVTFRPKICSPSPPRSLNPIFAPEEEQDLLNKTGTTKTISNRVPSILPRKGGAEVAVRDYGTDPLPVGGKLTFYQAKWSELVPEFPEIISKVSLGILITFSENAPSLLRHPLELLSNNKTSDLLQALTMLLESRANRRMA